MASTTVEIDSRGRLSLGKVAKAGTYLATTQDNGTIILEPAVTITATELAIMRNPKVAADLDAALAGTMPTADFDWKNR